MHIHTWWWYDGPKTQLWRYRSLYIFVFTKKWSLPWIRPTCKVCEEAINYQRLPITQISQTACKTFKNNHLVIFYYWTDSSRVPPCLSPQIDTFSVLLTKFSCLWYGNLIGWFSNINCHSGYQFKINSNCWVHIHTSLIASLTETSVKTWRAVSSILGWSLWKWRHIIITMY